MLKLNSVISAVQKTLAPDVFDKDGFLHPEIQAAIEERIVKVVPAENIKALYILGSITGYKWEDVSDIDVSVYVFPFDPTKDKTKATKEINGFPVKPFNRPLSFFLMEWKVNTESSILKTDFGVYDVRARAWINPPGDPTLVRNPQDEFWVELQTARLLTSEFNRKAEEYLKDKAELALLKAAPREPGDLFAYNKINRKLKEVESGYNGLLKFVDELDKDRKFAYSYSWGIPRNSEENIIFKSMHHGKYSELFEELLEVNSQSKLK